MAISVRVEKVGRGRRPLPLEEKRTDLHWVRLNRKERRRLHHLSGLLDLVRLADVFREGLLALEEQDGLRSALLEARQKIRELEALLHVGRSR